MPMSEEITRDEYDIISNKIKKKLSMPPFDGKIKCLLTTYDVPIRVAALTHTGKDRARRRFLNDQVDACFSQVNQLAMDYSDLDNTDSKDVTSVLPANKVKIVEGIIKRKKTLSGIIQKLRTSQAKAKHAIAISTNGVDISMRYLELEARWSGMQGKAKTLLAKLNSETHPKAKHELQQKYIALNIELQKIAAPLKTLAEDPYNTDAQKKRYAIINRLAGLSGLVNVTLAERKSLGDIDSVSAFDSELSLVMWSKYLTSEQMPNTLYTYNDPAVNSASKEMLAQKTMMVARLDGPTVKIAKSLVDKAIEGESRVIMGHAYFDARGKYKDKENYRSYAFWDECVRKTADMVKNTTKLRVVSDNKESLFAVGRCPDTVLYCGWYSVRKYIDSFKYARGAIAWHIASYEAETLKKSSSRVWCKQMLERGVTATLGAVAEPFLHTFPRPDLFYKELIMGKGTLVECFYHTKPYNSWMFMLIGDPLYSPKYAMAKTKLPVANIVKPVSGSNVSNVIKADPPEVPSDLIDVQRPIEVNLDKLKKNRKKTGFKPRL